MAGAYFREITFVELLPNEAYLVIESGEYKNPVRLKEQLEKLLKDPEYSVFSDVIEYMIKNRIRLEQESLIC